MFYLSIESLEKKESLNKSFKTLLEVYKAIEGFKKVQLEGKNWGYNYSIKQL